MGAGENLLSVFAGFLAPAFSTALFGCRADQLFSGAAIAPYYGWPVADRNGLVQVLVDRDRAPRQSVAESSLVDLPRPLPDGHGAVLLHHAFRLHREDPVQVAPLVPQLFVEVPDIQVVIGFLVEP